MSLICNFLPEIVDDILESLEVCDVFIDHILGIDIIFLSDEGIEGFLVIGDDSPASADAAEDIAEILHPAIEILILSD